MLTIFGLVFLILQINSATSQTDSLVRGQELRRNQRIVSTNRIYSLAMRSNGNLAIFRRDKIIMEHDTFGRGDVFRMRLDGNAVLYGLLGRVLWQTRTTGRGRYIRIQNDGDLVVFNSTNQPIWRSRSAGLGRVAFAQSSGVNSSNVQAVSFPEPVVSTRKGGMATLLNKGNDKDKMFVEQSFTRRDNRYVESENGMFTLAFREDGNFGIEEKNGKSIWTIGAGRADSIVFHPSGNLALFDNNPNEAESLLWQSKTKGEEGANITVLLLKNDGNLVILDQNNKVKWQSGTAQKQNSGRTHRTTTTTTERTTTMATEQNQEERSVDFNKNASVWFVKNWDDGNIAVVLPLAVDGLDDSTKQLVMAHVRSNEKLGDAYAENKYVYNRSWEDLIKRIAGNVKPALNWG